MKNRIRLDISPAAIAIALFCAVAIFTPTLTSTDITRKDSHQLIAPCRYHVTPLATLQ